MLTLFRQGYCNSLFHNGIYMYRIFDTICNHMFTQSTRVNSAVLSLWNRPRRLTPEHLGRPAHGQGQFAPPPRLVPGGQKKEPALLAQALYQPSVSLTRRSYPKHSYRTPQTASRAIRDLKERCISWCYLRVITRPNSVNLNRHPPHRPKLSLRFRVVANGGP